jgi:DNA-binding winged helix-turn-helix (wHTH) protein
VAIVDVTYRFSGFRVDSVRRLLFGPDGRPIALKPRVFDTLLYLVQHRGELLEKHALLDAIWPGVVVEENNLSQAISTLRRIFGETRGENAFIVTEPGRGYRFVAAVETAKAVPVGNEVERPSNSGSATKDQARNGSALRWLSVCAAGLALAGAVVAGGYAYWQHRLQTRLLYDSTIPEIETAIDAGDFEQAFARISEAQSRMPDARELGELMKRAAWRVDLKSEPAGARVLRRAYGAAEDAWVELGVTPLEDVYLPFGLSQLRLEREGSVPLLRAIGGGGLVFSELPERDEREETFWYVLGSETFKLDAVGTIPDGKVRVPGVRELASGESVAANDFFLDRHEVTNAQYKTFVAAGGYEDSRWWDPELPWDEVRTRLTDRTGRPGPSTWEGGDYPRGADDLPVTGVSWYEASAYARFMG